VVQPSRAGCPHWDMLPAAAFLAATAGTNRAHNRARGLGEHRLPDEGSRGAWKLPQAMKFVEFAVDGGACRNDFLMPFPGGFCSTARSAIPLSGVHRHGGGVSRGAGGRVLENPGEIAVLRTSEKNLSFRR